MKNPPRHNLKSRKTEEAEEAAPPEKSSPLTDAIAAQRARPRRKKKVHSCSYNWRHYTCKIRSWNMTNASKKVDGCPEGSLYFILPLSKKGGSRGKEWSQPPVLLYDGSLFFFHRVLFASTRDTSPFYSLQIREQPSNYHKCLILTASLHSFSIFYYLFLFFLFSSDEIFS